MWRLFYEAALEVLAPFPEARQEVERRIGVKPARDGASHSHTRWRTLEMNRKGGHHPPGARRESSHASASARP
jgi:hypothetical protein